MRAVSLLEVMVAIALIGIMAAMAVPSLVPLKARALLAGETETVSALVARARMEAMTRKRCARVSGGAVVRIEASRNIDCEGLAGPWDVVAQHRIDPAITVSLVPPFPADSPGDAIVFRPTGRVFGRDRDRGNDAAQLRITGREGTNHVFVQGNGLTCTLRGGAAPLPSAAGPRCP